MARFCKMWLSLVLIPVVCKCRISPSTCHKSSASWCQNYSYNQNYTIKTRQHYQRLKNPSFFFFFFFKGRTIKKRGRTNIYKETPWKKMEAISFLAWTLLEQKDALPQWDCKKQVRIWLNWWRAKKMIKLQKTRQQSKYIDRESA